MRIVLRPVTLNDGKHIVKWRNDESVKAHCMKKNKVTLESNADFFYANVETGKYKQYMVERIDEDFGVAAYPIATVYLKDMDYENKRCELCIFTSNDEEWMSESQTIAIKMLIDKAFNEFRMHKIYSYVFYKYSQEVELLKSAGFVLESVLKEEAVNECGEYEDVIRLCIINETKI